ncbi:unnamed protein product [Dibothriocephalus latus]|uniref:Dynein light chain n=1 Tax=Dibothriocephalus latus TaxID=60516 RepID=A0A3P7LG62_DIBLA|nr:unnamed protein product [Dibothriocephalus latus]
MNAEFRCLVQQADPCAGIPQYIRKDLNEKVEAFFLEMVSRACKTYDDPLDLCTAIRQCLDMKFGPQWHVIVGETFGRHPDGKCNDSRPDVVDFAMSEHMLNDCLYLVYLAYTEYDEPEDLCTTIKQHLDMKYGDTWHVIVGPEFGA